jgi:hypothetical protein
MSEKPQQPFRERILSADAVDPALREKYQKEIQTMFEKQLTGGQRLAHIFTAVLSIVSVIVFSIAAVLVPRSIRGVPNIPPAIPILIGVAFGIGAVFGLAWAVLLFRILRRGSTQLRKDPKTMAGLTWGFVVIMVTIFMIVADRPGDHLWGVQMVVNGLVFLVGAAVFLINSVVQDSQLKTQEKLLEIEYRLAEIAERIKK